MEKQMQAFIKAMTDNQISGWIYEERGDGSKRLKFNNKEKVWECPITQSHWVIYCAALS